MKPAVNSSPRRISVLLWTVNLASITASVFAYVYLAWFVYLRTGSVVWSEAVLLAPMVVPVLLCLAINRLASASAPRPLLVGFNAAGVAVALATFASIDRAVVAAVLGALIIGFIDAMQRVARTVAIKRYFSSADVGLAVPITLTAQFIAGGLAGVALSFYKADMTPGMAGTIVTGAFALAGVAAWLLPRVADAAERTATDVMPAATRHAAEPAANALRQLASLLRGDGALRRRFFAFLIVVSVFQGFYNVSRVSLPTHVLALTQVHVGYLQTVGAMAALAAALLFFCLGKQNLRIGRIASALLGGASLIAMVAATATRDVPLAFGLYFAYMFLWELLFFKVQSDIVTATPADRMALVATFQYAGVYLGMLVFAAAGTLITRYATLTTAAIAFAIAFVVLMSLNARRAHRT